MAARSFQPPWSVDEQDACLSRARIAAGRCSRMFISIRSDDLAKCSLQDWPLGSPWIGVGEEYEPYCESRRPSGVRCVAVFGRGRNGDALPIFKRSPWIVSQLFCSAILVLFAAGLMGVMVNLGWLQ
jgi:hypothetical protein